MVVGCVSGGVGGCLGDGYVGGDGVSGWWWCVCLVGWVGGWWGVCLVGWVVVM